MRRTALAVGAVALLGLLAGCFGPAQIPEGDLTGDASYRWDRNASAAYDLSRSSYAAVYDVTNRTSLSVHDRDALGTESPIRIRALQFRFPNGTVVNATQANLSATLGQRRTTISLPARDGEVGYTAPRSGKQFSIPVAVPGPQEIRLPPGARVGVPVLSQVNPGGYETTVADGRMTVRWPNRTGGTLSVHYYLQRDLLLFSLLVLVALALGVGGSAYYLRQIRRLERRREAVGDGDDESGDRRPPPGAG